ncbi:unnamed protein product, partial [Phaeothamnion confervicola]
MKHTVPCVGYCIQEMRKPGRLRVEVLEEALQRNAAALTAASDHRDPRRVFRQVKAMQPGETFTFPDGESFTYEQVISPPRRGRKVVILGDTCDASAMAPLAMDADVVVHEATNTFLPPFDAGKSYREVEADTISHGHSTPHMAARFARQVRARQLVLSHFSPRYKGDDSLESAGVMRRIEAQAAKSGGFRSDQVVAAWDLLCLPVATEDAW